MELSEKYKLIEQFASSLATKKEEKEETYFLLIGIDKYIKEVDAHHCKEDAENLLNIFHSDTADRNIYKLYDYEATKVSILSHIENLSKIAKPNDNVIVYFSGHGFNNNYSNFFIPSDGKRDLEMSCITNKYIFDALTECLSKAVLLIFDYVFEKDTVVNQSSRVEHEFINTIYNTEKKQTSTYSSLLDFFKSERPNKVKESYLFVKSGNFETKKIGSHSEKKEMPFVQDQLGLFLSKKYNNLKTLSHEEKTKEILLQLRQVLENNDSDLLSRCITLEYKLDQLDKEYQYREIDRKEYQSEIKEVDGLTAELIEKVNDNGFYLIRVPKNQSLSKIREAERSKILFASANPIDSSPLRLDRELREIEYELLKSRQRDKFEIIKFQALRIGDLQDALLEHSPQFVHFSGHGNCEGISLVDDLDNTKLVRSKPLSNLFKLFAGDIKCVFLNSCHSIEQSKEISKSISKVVCMSRSVPDEVAIQFAKAFYKCIGAGRDVDFSFKFAQNSIELYDLSGSDIPVLLP